MDKVEESHDETVVEVVDEPDAVDEVLRRNLEPAASHGQIDQIRVVELDLAAKLVLGQAVGNERERLQIDVDEVRLQLIGFLDGREGVEYFRSRA